MHANMLIGKITATENGYAKVVSQFGVTKVTLQHPGYSLVQQLV